LELLLYLAAREAVGLGLDLRVDLRLVFREQVEDNILLGGDKVLDLVQLVLCAGQLAANAPAYTIFSTRGSVPAAVLSRRPARCTGSRPPARTRSAAAVPGPMPPRHPNNFRY
jgi:hypothetical protein